MKPKAKKLRHELISRLLDKKEDTARLLAIATDLPPRVWDNLIQILEKKT